MRKAIAVMSVFVFVGLCQVVADDEMVINGGWKSQDELVTDILLDWDLYEGKVVQAEEFFYIKLGVWKKYSFYQASQWFLDASQLYPSGSTFSLHVNFLFNPDPEDREARRWVLQTTGKNYPSPMPVSMELVPLKHTLNTGLTPMKTKSGWIQRKSLCSNTLTTSNT